MEALHAHGPHRQGALPRRVHHVRVAVRQDEPRGGAERLDAVRQHAVPVQPALPRGGAGDVPLLPRPGHRRHDLQPARARLSGARRRRPRARHTTCYQDYYGDEIDREIARRVREVARTAGRDARRTWPWPGSQAVPNHNVPIVGAAKTAQRRRRRRGAHAASSMPGSAPSSRRPTGRATRSTTRTRCDVPGRPASGLSPRASLEHQPRAVLSNFDQRRTIRDSASRTDCAKCSARDARVA